MEFGKLDQSALTGIHTLLPKFSEGTVSSLHINKAISKGSVFLGCAKWGRKEWVGPLYPKGTQEKHFLREYAKHFNCIEFNATFYQIYPSAKIESFVKEVGEDFLFCPKFSQGITHFRRLKNCEALTSSFLESISAFGKNLGPCFLQLPDNFAPKNLDVLQAFLLSLPKDLEVFVELRHTNWFTTEYRDKVFDFLASNNNGWVTTDTSGRRDVVHTELPIPKAFIRFVANNHHTDYPRIDEWVDKIKEWLESGIHEVYFMLHSLDESKTPILAEYTTERFNNICGLELPIPRVLKQ